ncbi:class I glutamine amidotransferase-like protein [Kockovaella imperatae]|uniref:glutaminase n=1 Tax=Kockovaella imperatae TaxID=4999 RepID=A0A1Y1U9L8_9TREE|nr:class I glutamine amidotransferase-like protein [Kockovaella imperatae]ORX34729.1 class I glutamine amidotransferase-like protein [Kockovaella imperatae]
MISYHHLTLATSTTMTLPMASSSKPRRVIIGVLALQGAFIEHIHYLERLRIPNTVIRAIPIRTADQLESCEALIIPGGESTVIQSVAERTEGLLPILLDFVRNPQRAVWGTCAGMILMAEEDGIGGGKVIKGRPPQKGWGGIEGLKVWRNLYGTQLESFEAHMEIPALSQPTKPFNCIFIRAPAVHSLQPKSTSVADLTQDLHHTIAPTETSTTIEVLATLPSECTPPPPPQDSHLGPSNHEDLGKVMIRQGSKLVTSFHPELSGDTRIHQYWVEKCVLGM